MGILRFPLIMIKISLLYVTLNFKGDLLSMMFKLIQAIFFPFILSLICLIFKKTINKIGCSDNYEFLPANLVESIRDRDSIGLQLAFLSLVVLVSTYQMRETTITHYFFIADEKEWYIFFLILILITAILIVFIFFLTITTCKREHKNELKHKKDAILSCKLNLETHPEAFCVDLHKNRYKFDTLKKSIPDYVSRVLILSFGAGTLSFCFSFFWLTSYFFSDLWPVMSGLMP